MDNPTPLIPTAVPKEEIDLTGSIYEILTSPINPPIAVKTLVPGKAVDSPPKEVFDQNGNVYGLVSSTSDPMMNGDVVTESQEVPLKRKLEDKDEEADAKNTKTGNEEDEDGDDEDEDDGILDI